MQVFDLPGRSHLSFTEYYKGTSVGGGMPESHKGPYFYDVRTEGLSKT